MNAPKLRFKEFSDEWISKKLFQLVEFSKGNILAKADLAETGNYPCILYGQLYTKYNEVIRKIYSKTNRNENNIPKSKKGDILIPSSGETPIDISTSSCIQIDNVLLGGDINILRPISCDGRFLSYLINNNKKTEIAKVAQGHSVVHLYNDNLKQVSINIPSIQEQKRISDTLELLDKKIELQTKKIEDLKLFKKGLILSLKKNSFNWHTVCIKDLFKITRGVVIPKNELSEFKSGEYKYPVYSSQTSNQGVLGYSDTFDFNGKYLTWTTDGANAGKVFYRNGKFRCTNVCGVLYEDNIRFTNELFAELLNYETPKHVSYVGNPKLMNNIMANIKIKIPSDDIQENISLVINTINHKVNLENKKLLKLQELKKGLMQSMFV